MGGLSVLQKTPTGITGFDEITGGGLPKGRPSLITGGPGSGKTLFAMEFIVNGARDYNEPGVFVSFEETPEELTKNVASLGFDIEKLSEHGMVDIEHISVEPSEIVETGEYDLEGLFIRLGMAIDSIGAKRVALDTIESIFSSFSNTLILRAELRRLFRWLKEKGVTAIITGEKGEKSLTRSGLEEYVSDAVIVLDNRIVNQIATRRLRIVKYRGSSHGSNEYPFMIDETGFSVLPITSVGLTSKASKERISTGIKGLDEMLGGKGYFEGSTILVSGGAGTGKTSFASEFADSACRRGEKVLFISYEESPDQVLRNMGSIGLNLKSCIDKGKLMIHSDRPTTMGLEMHLVLLHNIVEELEPDVIVIDPISSLLSIGSEMEVKSTLVRLIDYLKMRGVTTLFTDLIHGYESEARTMVSSLIDTWIMLEDVESNGEKNRIIRIIKSRGMAHSNQLREFQITSKGVQLIVPYIGPGGVLTGTARLSQEMKEREEEIVRSEEIEALRATLEAERRRVEAEIASLDSTYQDKKREVTKKIAEEVRRIENLERNKNKLKKIRTKVGGSAK